MKKILYCVVGSMAFGVIEDEITNRDGFFIKVPRIFTMQPVPTQVMSPKGQIAMDFIIAKYENVIANCDFISDLSPDSTFYRGIMDGLKVEGRKLNEN